MPAPVNEGNIIVGSGRLSTSIDDGDTWVEMGGTEDGAEFSMGKEFHDVKAAEAPITLRKELTDLTGSVSTGLLESTLDNLLLSWPGNIEEGAPAIGDSTATIGTDGETQEIQLKFVGKGPEGTTRTIIFPRAVSTGDGGHRYTKGSNTIIGTELEVMPTWDETAFAAAGGWVFGTVVDVVPVVIP